MALLLHMCDLTSLHLLYTLHLSVMADCCVFDVMCYRKKRVIPREMVSDFHCSPKTVAVINFNNRWNQTQKTCLYTSSFYIAYMDYTLLPILFSLWSSIALLAAVCNSLAVHWCIMPTLRECINPVIRWCCEWLTRRWCLQCDKGV